MKPAKRNMLVGTFVLAALLLLIVALYFIGNKQNLFGNTFRIAARFYNVNGLTKGNNVRFAGIDIGTVESVKVVNDSSVYVVMVIENDMNPFIRTNALASVGTDGLMGNKLVNINAGSNEAPVIREGQLLQTLRPVEMDVMVRTLDVTNQNLQVITSNLKHITNKINSENSLWNILMDTVIAGNVKSSFENIQRMSNGGVRVLNNLEQVSGNINRGKGSLGMLVQDTMFALTFKNAVTNLRRVGDTVALISQDLSNITSRLKDGKGTAGKLLKDTLLAYDLDQSLVSVKKAADSFDENMTALHSSWPFKKYFKKIKKEKK